MLRISLIASLLILNLSVWVGPAEVLAARGKAMLDRRPQYERAQQYVMNNNVASAVREYQRLLKEEPNNAVYHTDYALLCFNNAEYLLSDLGWKRSDLIATVQSEMKQARDLSPEDYSASAQYALALMDTDFFGTALPVDVVVEAWTHTVELTRKYQGTSVAWNSHDTAIAHAYLQLARTEFRYGRMDEMEKYIEQALAENPGLRIPRELRRL